MTVTALIARAIGRVAVVDVAWGLGFVAIAVTTALVGDGDATRRWLVPVLVATWGLRLAWHIRRRAVGAGGDPRYEQLLGGPVREVGVGVGVRRGFVVQGAAMWFIALPLQVAAATQVSWSPVVVAGCALSMGGLVFEATGDAQLA